MCGCSKNIRNCNDVVMVRRCICWCEPAIIRSRRCCRCEPRKNCSKSDEGRNRRCNCHIEGISLQLTSIDEKELPPKCPVVFNKQLTDNSRFISYNDEVGSIEIFKRGTYLIDWDVAVDGNKIDNDDFVRFGLEINEKVTAASTLPKTVGQISGQALIQVDQMPTTIKLINDTNKSIQLSKFMPIANLRIVAVE